MPKASAYPSARGRSPIQLASDARRTKVVLYAVADKVIATSLRILPVMSVDRGIATAQQARSSNASLHAAEVGFLCVASIKPLAQNAFDPKRH